MNTRLALTLLLAGAALLAACSADNPSLTPPGGDPDFVSGDLEPAGPSFAIAVNAADGPDERRPGPFILRGENLRWLSEPGALAVDLTIENAGTGIHPEPVGLTFIALLPGGVRVLDADNGLEGPGAAIIFGFANDDALWTPGEISFPRTVTFAVAEGAAVAFAARLNIGSGPLAGVIAGRVWNDLDHDGASGELEMGIPGVPVMLLDPDAPADSTGSGDPGFVRLTRTDADGRYRFAGLPAGLHTVGARPVLPLEPTTPTELHVLLAELPDGTVSSFEGADFGFFAEEPVAMLELEPAADTTVRADVDSRMNDNYGCDPYVAVGRGRAGEPDRIRGLVRFDLPQFFREVSVVRATLVAPVALFRDGSSQVYRLAVHAVAPADSARPWQEGNGSEHVDFGLGCEWVDPAHGVAWIGAGDGGDANNQTQPPFLAAAAAVTTVVQDGMGPIVLAQWDVTALVEAWYSGRLPNDGLVIRDVGEPGDFRSLWFASREGEEAGVGRALRLVIEFSDVPPPR